ncbi:hypothetical protein ACFVR2_07470 [Gottfriedia sp. NPDC057991]|uniref:hypothetical protein n=1 Tax=Gottfriedia sp. NPDC057991 TaxID=3346298 RepID=UPI0036DC512F
MSNFLSFIIALVCTTLLVIIIFYISTKKLGDKSKYVFPIILFGISIFALGYLAYNSNTFFTNNYNGNKFTFYTTIIALFNSVAVTGLVGVDSYFSSKKEDTTLNGKFIETNNLVNKTNSSFLEVKIKMEELNSKMNELNVQYIKEKTELKSQYDFLKIQVEASKNERLELQKQHELSLIVAIKKNHEEFINQLKEQHKNELNQLEQHLRNQLELGNQANDTENMQGKKDEQI